MDAAELRDDGPDGAALLDELCATLTSYVVFADEHAPAAVALWIATTHCLPAFECAPRLVIATRRNDSRSPDCWTSSPGYLSPAS